MIYLSMFSTPIVVVLGLASGIHAACCGAYKDIPYEGFNSRSFFREIIISIGIAGLFNFFITNIASIGMAFFFLIIMGWSRIFTEAYKLFVRVESQKNYLIPSQVHLFRKIVEGRIGRFLFGLFGAFVLIVLLSITSYIERFINSGIIIGLLIGLISGLAVAFCGAYKDGYFEGFSSRKFFRSPIICVLNGLVLSKLTILPGFLFFGSIGLERMIIECYKTFFKPGYSPGKFKHKAPSYIKYYKNRRFFVFPYIGTWVLFLAMFLTEILG